MIKGKYRTCYVCSKEKPAKEMGDGIKCPRHTFLQCKKERARKTEKAKVFSVNS